MVHKKFCFIVIIVMVGILIVYALSNFNVKETDEEGRSYIAMKQESVKDKAENKDITPSIKDGPKEENDLEEKSDEINEKTDREHNKSDSNKKEEYKENGDESKKQDEHNKSDKEEKISSGKKKVKKANADKKVKGVFNVTFKDYDGTVLKVEELKEGENATAPQNPVRDGYEFIKWDTAYENVITDLEVTAIYEEITEPTIIVSNGVCNAGEEIEISVTTVKNPGLLGAVFSIEYDESAMTLKSVENGNAMKDYTFTPPKNIKNDCNIAWNTNDVPKGNKDGEILKMKFEIAKDTPIGNYSVSIKDNKNAFDSEYKMVSFHIVEGFINVN